MSLFRFDSAGHVCKSHGRLVMFQGITKPVIPSLSSNQDVQIMSKKSRSKLWFLVHSWLALPIWFFVLIVCVTGTLAVVSQEIVWLVNPEIRARKPSDDAALLSYDQVVAAIKQAQPQTKVPRIVRPDETNFALEV